VIGRNRDGQHATSRKVFAALLHLNSFSNGKGKGINFTLEQAAKAQRGSRDIALLFL
jgi:hypothetical protein